MNTSDGHSEPIRYFERVTPKGTYRYVIQKMNALLQAYFGRFVMAFEFIRSYSDYT
jgi:hypothetical protein